MAVKRRFESRSESNLVPLPGFSETRQRIGAADLHVATAGDGPALVLLHGFPQTGFCWRRVAPDLAQAYTVVVPDLPGYGASRSPAGGPRGEGFSKREMAAAIVELMTTLGHPRFAVVGHDRGARVSYRLALDHPDRVTHVAVLNTVPTLDQFERIGDDPSLGYWPWFLLAQPAPFPERLLEADPEGVLEHVFATWTTDPAAIDPEAPAVLRRWADDVTALEVPGGHFVPEEAPAELTAALRAFLG